MIIIYVKEAVDLVYKRCMNNFNNKDYKYMHTYHNCIDNVIKISSNFKELDVILNKMKANLEKLKNKNKELINELKNLEKSKNKYSNKDYNTQAVRIIKNQSRILNEISKLEFKISEIDKYKNDETLEKINDYIIKYQQNIDKYKKIKSYLCTNFKPLKDEDGKFISGYNNCEHVVKLSNNDKNILKNIDKCSENNGSVKKCKLELFERMDISESNFDYLEEIDNISSDKLTISRYKFYLFKNEKN